MRSCIISFKSFSKLSCLINDGAHCGVVINSEITTSWVSHIINLTLTHGIGSVLYYPHSPHPTQKEKQLGFTTPHQHLSQLAQPGVQWVVWWPLPPPAPTLAPSPPPPPAVGHWVEPEAGLTVWWGLQRPAWHAPEQLVVDFVDRLASGPWNGFPQQTAHWAQTT